MKNLLHIKKPVGNKHIFVEHLLKSAFAFTGTYAALLFGPMFMEGKNRHRDKNEMGTGGDIFEYMITHPEVQISIAIAAVIIFNIYIIYKNTRINYLVSIDVDEANFKLGISNLIYKEKVKFIELPIENLKYIIHTKTSESDGKKQTLNFIDNRTDETLALLKPRHFLWNDQVKEIRSALIELKDLGVEKERSSSKAPSVVGRMFRR